jgi:hypothetical protein
MEPLEKSWRRRPLERFCSCWRPRGPKPDITYYAHSVRRYGVFGYLAYNKAGNASEGPLPLCGIILTCSEQLYNFWETRFGYIQGVPYGLANGPGGMSPLLPFLGVNPTCRRVQQSKTKDANSLTLEALAAPALHRMDPKRQSNAAAPPHWDCSRAGG